MSRKANRAILVFAILVLLGVLVSINVTTFKIQKTLTALHDDFIIYGD